MVTVGTCKFIVGHVVIVTVRHAFVYVIIAVSPFEVRQGLKYLLKSSAQENGKRWKSEESFFTHVLECTFIALATLWQINVQ